MAEPPAWRYQKIIKPMFDLPQEHVLLRGRVLTARGDEAIEDGFVEFDAGKIRAVGGAPPPRHPPAPPPPPRTGETLRGGTGCASSSRVR
jgi:hypothetical protein